MKKFLLALLLTLLPCVALGSECEILIAGGGMGGTAAALQASRMGAKVFVIEPTYMLGGQATAAGVSTMDDMSHIESGLYKEFMDRIREYYGAMKKSIATPYWKINGKAFEPSVGNKILEEMVKSEDIKIFYHSEIISADLENKIAAVKTPEGLEEIKFKILIDATEYGDILELAGVPYRSGNSIYPGGSDKYFIQDITWTAIIRKYPRGVPLHLRPENPLPGYEKAKKNYEGYVTLNGFDFKGRYPVKMPVNLLSHNAYRAVPDSFLPGSYTGHKRDWRRITKTGVNWGNDYPGMYFWKGHYGLTSMYLEDKALRAQIEYDALIKTLHFIYYIQHELGANWSIDENEYGELPYAARDLPDEWKEIAKHMPPIPYVRESRRMLGEFTLNSKSVHENSLSWRNGQPGHEFYDAIAIGGYNLDVHGGDDDNDLESSLGEKQSSIWQDMPQGPFQVPMRILIPMSADNFLAAEKNLSMSRLVSSALRLQPICMMTGQAVGALAATAVEKNLQPREVLPFYVQRRLVNDGVVISLCVYSDVPRGHKFYNAVQLASLYELLAPRRYQRFEAKSVNIAQPKGEPGRFGINDKISEKDFKELKARAEKITGRSLALPEFDSMTRGEALELVINAM